MKVNSAFECLVIQTVRLRLTTLNLFRPGNTCCTLYCRGCVQAVGKLQAVLKTNSKDGGKLVNSALLKFCFDYLVCGT